MKIEWPRAGIMTILGRPFSVTILFCSVGLAWFGTACVEDPMDNRWPIAWYYIPELLVELTTLVVASALAARLWYWTPVFFGFGGVVVLPAVARLTQTFVVRDIVAGGWSPSEYTALYSTWPGIALCCASASVAAVIGRRYSGPQIFKSNSPNRTLPSTTLNRR